MDLKNWKLWIVLGSALLALILPVFFVDLQHSEQNKAVVENYLNMPENTFIDVIIYDNDYQSALEYIQENYPNFEIIDHIYLENKKSFWFRLKKVKE